MIFSEILAFTLLGCLVGIFTGIIPGIHINMISALVVASLPIFSSFSPISVASLIMAMSVTHTFLNFIPSVLFGAPDPDSALSVLPGHQMLLAGRGLEAIKLTGLGSLISLLITAMVFLPVVFILPLVYDFVKTKMFYILLVVTGLSIGTERNFLKAGFLFLLSGALGMLLLNSKMFTSGIIFPALTGMFGTSTLLLSMQRRERIPQQIKAKASLKAGSVLKNSILGAVAGMIVGFLPGVGATQATHLVQKSNKKRDAREFLVATSGVNTANIIFTLVVLYAIGRTRSGVVIAIEKIVENFGMVELVVLLGVILGAGGIAMLLHVWIGTFFTKQIGKSKEGFYNKINILILLIILGSVFWLTGFIGLLILFLCTVIGLIAPMSKVKRSQCMGFFIIPVMLYYGGVGVWLMTLLQI